MLRSYLNIAQRHLIKHKGYAMLNGAGLALGMACCLLMLLYVRDELSYDRFHEQADRIYRINAVSENPEGAFYRTNLPPPVAPALQSEYPEVESVTRLAERARTLIRVGGDTYQEDRFFLGEASFLKIFSFRLLRGDAQTALKEPGTVVITESTAQKYFGETNAIGQVIQFENSVDLTVVGVLQDIASNSHLQIDLLAALETKDLAREGWLEAWGSSSTATYALLRPNTGPEAVEAKLPGFVDTYLKDSLDDDESYTLSLQALPEIHLYPHQAPERIWAASNLKYVYIFSIIGVLMLLIACINYINLATAKATGRSREVGVRKVLGSNRAQLVAQFLGESLLLAGGALLVALILVVLSLPAFNALADKTLALKYFAEPEILLGLLGMWAFVGFASGSYPALYLSGFHPAIVIKGGNSESGRPTLLRNGLVIVQFTAAVVLIAGTMVVGDQLDFMHQKDLGFEKEQVVIIPIRDRQAWQNTDALKTELLTLPSVQSVSFSSGIPNNVGWNSTASWEGAETGEELEVNHIMVDFDFLQVYGFKLLAGRGFSRAFPGDDTGAFVLNEAAVQAIGWQDPLGKKFNLWDREAPVIGVVKDFHYESLHQSIGPLVFHIRNEWYRMASVKIQPNDVSVTLSDLETIVAGFIPDRPFEYSFLDSSFDQLYRTEERFRRISAYVTALAILLASLGLLGLIAYVVERRTKEIGIRKVLGASALSIVVMLSGRFVRLAALAFVFAAPIAYIAASRWLDGFAFHVDLSAWTFFLAGLYILAIVSLVVGYQTIQAALSNPADTMRYE